MVALDESLTSVTHRPLPLRRRPDLVCSRQIWRRRTQYVVKEPIALKYYWFDEQEFFLLEQLQQSITLKELKDRFERRFAPYTIDYRFLQQFIAQLHKNGLLISHGVDQGRQLWERARKQKWQKFRAFLANPLAVRWKGIDPDWLLKVLCPFLGWLFHPISIFVASLWMIAALVLLLANYDAFTAKLPTFQQFFGSGNWLWLMIAMGATKVFHEIGHGVSCKKYGGECHELGFMLLVLTPSLYCNTSDSWMFPSKWQRIAVGAAGIYFELILASIATFAWWYSNEGIVHNLALNVMFLASVSTLLFNGNPLLKFDGYYILSDWIGIPNLKQRSTQVLQNWVYRHGFGVEMDELKMTTFEKLFLATYGVASIIYRWLIVFSILIFLHSIFAPFGFAIIGQVIGVMGIAMLVIQPGWQLFRFLKVPGRMQQMKWKRTTLFVSSVLAVVGSLLFYPLPYYVHAPFTLEPVTFTTVYAEFPGTVQKVHVQELSRVEAGTLLIECSNSQMEAELNELVGRKDRLVADLEQLEARRAFDPTAAAEIKPVRESLLALESLVAKKQANLADLQIRATASGVIYPVLVSKPQPQGNEVLPEWSGSVLHPKNLGTALQKGDAVCKIGDPAQIQAVLAIDQSVMEFVTEEQLVWLQLESAPSELLEGRVHFLAKQPMEQIPESLAVAAGGAIATKPSTDGSTEALTPTFQAKVPVEMIPMEFRAGLRGNAKIEVGRRSVAHRLYRLLLQTFNFKLAS